MKTIKHSTAERRAIEEGYFQMIRDVGEGSAAAKWIEQNALPQHRQERGTASNTASQAGLVDYFHIGMTNGRERNFQDFAAYDPFALKLIALGAKYANEASRPAYIAAIVAQQNHRDRCTEKRLAQLDRKWQGAAQ